MTAETQQPMREMMYRVVYASAATRAFSDEELLDLLDASRRRNTTRNVTGILLHRSDRFLQVLEGERDVLEQLYDKISRDPRHSDCRILLQGETQEREFEDWSMGFENLDQLTEQDVPGLSKFLDEPFTSDYFLNNRSAVQTMIGLFRVRA